MEKKAIYQAMILALGIAGLSGCGGGSSGSTPSSSTTVSGTVTDAPITGASVCLMDGTTQVACTTSDSSTAAYSLTFNNLNVPSADLLRIIATKGNIELVSAVGNLATLQTNSSNQNITHITTAQFLIAKNSSGTSSDNIDPTQLPQSNSPAVTSLANYIQSIVDPCINNPTSCQPTLTAAAAANNTALSVTAIQSAITGKTLGNTDSQGSTVLQVNADKTYALQQYNNDATHTTQQGNWDVSTDSSNLPIITLTKLTETGVALGNTVIHVSLLGNSTNTTGATIIGTTNSGTTPLVFNASIPFTASDLSGKTLSPPANSSVRDNRVVFNADGSTGTDYTPSCSTSGVNFTWSINSSGSLTLDESQGCTGEVVTINLLDKSIPRLYKTAAYSVVKNTNVLNFAASPFTLSY